MPPVRGASGRLSVGRALGSGDHISIQRGGQADAGVELAGNGTPVRAELENRGHDSEAGCAVRVEKPGAAAGPCHWHDEVSRRKGQVYLTVVYDLERRVLLWVGDDR